jgi:N-acetyl-1-D-myo-inositol-2-amino-2-deoxy-alpha-D-glucopyranoside deacetylase
VIRESSAPRNDARTVPRASSSGASGASGRSVLFVHAHPDDESIGNGATMAKYAAEGARVTLVTCTLGEYGEIIVSGLADLAWDRQDRLGPYRATELAAAMKELGVADQRFLGGAGRYHDSGMMGTPSNERPDAFWKADVDEAASLLAEIIREVRPQVLVTYNDFGGYGHPDHIQAHRVAMRAVQLAADAQVEPHAVAKVYWHTTPRSVVEAGLDRMREHAAETGFSVAGSVDEVPFAAPDATVTTRIWAEDYADRKIAAMRAHATQVSVRTTPGGAFYALSNGLGWPVSGTECYTLRYPPCQSSEQGESAPSASGELEDDLFAGL